MAIAEANPAVLVLFMVVPSWYGLTGWPRPMKFMLPRFERTYHGARMKVICTLCGRGRLNWRKRRTGGWTTGCIRANFYASGADGKRNKFIDQTWNGAFVHIFR